MWFDGNKNYNLYELFQIASEKLILGPNEGLIATAFWTAFGKIALSSKADAQRNFLLEKYLANLQAKYFEIAVQNSFENRLIPFLTAKVKGEQLIQEHGNYQFNFYPDLYAPNLRDKLSLKYCTVNVGLPPLSQKIIMGASKIHNYYSSKHNEFRSDLLYPSETMNDHFIIAILAIADSKVSK